ncbi:MAG: S41 family peptidase, partial [Clostridia bacterium]|nr:S41 family peptidase [Clostridia bacterium]
EFVKIIALAQSEQCESFIFDVRNNGGGYLDEILAVLDTLLPEGPIINIVDKNGATQTHNSDANCIKGEMVVLCNGNTASAAELFTAALRDYKLAKTVGQTTFGKGTMQTTRLLSDGSALKLSVAFYNPPSNVSYDKIGIKPDYEIKLTEYWENRYFKMPIEEDTQLQKAIELLNSK